MYLKNNGDPRWNEGGIYKVILQGAGAALVAELGNGQGLDAALGAMASQLAAGKISEFASELASHITDDPDAQNLVANIISNIVSGGVGMLTGGESGSSAASSMDRNNRQLHSDELKWIEKNKNLFAEMYGLDPEEAKRLLIQQALRTVDVWWDLLFSLADLSDADMEKLGYAQAFLNEMSKGEKFKYSIYGIERTAELFTKEGRDDPTLFGYLYRDNPELVQTIRNATNGYTASTKELSDALNKYYAMKVIQGASDIQDFILENANGPAITNAMIDSINRIIETPGQAAKDVINYLTEELQAYGNDFDYVLDYAMNVFTAEGLFDKIYGEGGSELIAKWSAVDLGLLFAGSNAGKVASKAIFNKALSTATAQVKAIKKALEEVAEHAPPSSSLVSNAVGSLASHVDDIVSAARRSDLFGKVNISNIDIPWVSKINSIKRQGIAFEDWFASVKGVGGRLPENFPVFDRFEDGIASSLKTLDTQTASRLNNPGRIEFVVKGYVDQVIDQTRNLEFGGFVINQDKISKRVIELAVPSATNSVQLNALQNAAAYAKKHGVELNLYFTK